MKHLFIINPAAGKKGSTDVLVTRIVTELSALGLEYEIAFTTGQGDAERITRRAAEVGAPIRIYACGGDGTLNEVVNGAAGHEFMAVTNLPKGTGNDFLKIFGPDYRARFSDLTALVQGPQTAMDLMDCNGRLGIGSVCTGVDARIADDVHKYKSLPLVAGMGAYIIALVINVLFKGIARPTRLEIGGTQREGDTSIICVMNGRYYGGGFMPVGEAQPDDGVLDMLVVSRVSRLTLFRLVGKYAKGEYRKCPEHITDYHGSGLTVTNLDGRGVAVVDGEAMWGERFVICLSERKVNFFYPGDLSYRGTAKLSTLAAAL